MSLDERIRAANPYLRLLHVVWVFWLFLALAVPGNAESLFMAFDGAAVVVGDLEAGGAEVVFYTVSRSSLVVPVNRRIAERIVDQDGDGEIRVELERPAPPKFLAVAVELSSGRYGVLTPQGSPVSEVEPPADGLLEGPGELLDRFQEAKSYLELLLVRPGDGVEAGAWALTTGDGTPTDLTPSSDGIVTTLVSDMQPVGASPPPPMEYETADLLIRVVPAEMEYYVTRVDR